MRKQRRWRAAVLRLRSAPAASAARQARVSQRQGPPAGTSNRQAKSNQKDIQQGYQTTELWPHPP